MAMEAGTQYHGSGGYDTVQMEGNNILSSLGLDMVQHRWWNEYIVVTALKSCININQQEYYYTKNNINTQVSFLWNWTEIWTPKPGRFPGP